MFDVRCENNLPAASRTKVTGSPVLRRDLGVLKADSALRRLGRCDQLFDGFKHHRELLVVFLFEGFDLASEIAVCVHKPAELHESAHDCDVDFDSATAAEDAGEHGNALLGKSVRRAASASVRT